MRPKLLDRLRAALADRYAIEREIGRGGMAIVYLASDLKHPRQVAIKILKPDLASLVGPERFVREIEIAASLTHPHILPVHDSGQADGFLYYVMPFVEGESLRKRLDRRGAIPLRDALRVTREVGDALDFAHARGIVHRDIKPGNILLEAEHAVVSDFGIARAVSVAAGDQLTATGLGVGTAGYTSPEQALGDRDVDARSDLYSLGCVLYEMLAGERPYTGQSAQEILGKQITRPPPSIQQRVLTVPRAVDSTIRRALATDPGDRFSSVTAFVEALGWPVEVPPTILGRALQRLRTRTAAIALGALGSMVLAGILWFALPSGDGGAGEGAVADSLRYAIFPFDYAGVEAPLHEVQRLHDALLRWSGLSVADPFQVGELFADAGSGPLTHSKAVEIARRLGAGRYLRGSVTQVGDSLWVRAGVYDAGDAWSLLAEHTLRLPVDLKGADSAFAVLADRLLLRGIRVTEGSPPVGTRSLPARQAFARGQEALQDWDLVAADSAFSRAAQVDRAYTQAQLWVALVRAWRGSDPARWRVPAEQAALRRQTLSARDQAMADAVLAEGHADLGRACSIWRRLTDTHPYDFAVWFGLANCQSKDDAVVRDTTSPSGWSFRTSQHATLEAYRRAFELHPAILSTYRGGSFERLRRLLYASGSARRRGVGTPPDTMMFTADPAWQGDSLAFVPHPYGATTQPRPTTDPGALAEAVVRQRRQFRDIALAWVATFPRSADAMEALAISMAMLGDPSALDTLQRARTLVREPDERLRVAGADVWLRVAFALPDDHAQLLRARQLADSLIDRHPPGNALDPLLLAGLAALTGRAHRAAAYMRDPGASEELLTPPPLRHAGPVLLLYSAVGGPEDSLAFWEAELREAMERSVVPLRARDTAAWLAWPATMAFPTYRFASIPQLSRYDFLLELQAAWSAGDTARVRRRLEELGEARRRLDPAAFTMDALYPEAELLAALGDPRAAAEWLDPTLELLPQAMPHALAHPAKGASLVRVLALRARLAARLGDAEGAAAWAGAVTILWSDADPFLQPIVNELRRVAN